LWLLDHTQSLAFFEEALQIEASGGILLANGSRRQTPGAVFVHLAQTRDQKNEHPWLCATLTRPPPDVLSWYTRGAVTRDRCSYLGEYSGKEIRKGE
jgi:PHAX RNA-binding domain